VRQLIPLGRSGRSSEGLPHFGRTGLGDSRALRGMPKVSEEPSCRRRVSAVETRRHRVSCTTRRSAAVHDRPSKRAPRSAWRLIRPYSTIRAWTGGLPRSLDIVLAARRRSGAAELSAASPFTTPMTVGARAQVPAGPGLSAVRHGQVRVLECVHVCWTKKWPASTSSAARTRRFCSVPRASVVSEAGTLRRTIRHQGSTSRRRSPLR